MKLAGQSFRSKATYQFGRITKTSQNHIWISFNKTNDDSLKLTFNQFLELCYTSEDVKEEVQNRIERNNTLSNFM